jgi:hypothetical protein
MIISGYSYGTTWSEERTIDMDPGQIVEIWDNEISIVDMNYISSEITRILDIELDGVDGSTITISWEYDKYREIETSTTHIERGLFTDLMFFIGDVDPDNNGIIDIIQVNFKKVHLTNLVWMGIPVIMTATLIRSIGEILSGRKNRFNNKGTEMEARNGSPVISDRPAELKHRRLE